MTAPRTQDEWDEYSRSLAASWRTITVRIPPEDPRYPDGWWVHTGTGACVNGALAISGQPREHLDLEAVLRSLTEPAQEVA